MHLESLIDFRGKIAIHDVGVVAVDKRAERMVLLKGIAFSTKGHPTHLAAQGVDHRIALALAVEIRVPANTCKF